MTGFRKRDHIDCGRGYSGLGLVNRVSSGMFVVSSTASLSAENQEALRQDCSRCRSLFQTALFCFFLLRQRSPLSFRNNAVQLIDSAVGYQFLKGTVSETGLFVRHLNYVGVLLDSYRSLFLMVMQLSVFKPKYWNQ